jgi:hypothetical protein
MKLWNTEKSTMSQEVADHGTVPSTGAGKLGGGIRRAADVLAQVKPRSDRGFNRTIDEAIAVVEAEWKAQREHELAEKNRLDAARQKALMVREIMILPLLNDIATDFATNARKVLPNWQVQSSGDADVVYGMATTPAVDDGGPTSFVIKAAATVMEQGGSLNLAVECSCVDAQHLSTGKIRQITEKAKSATMTKFDDLGAQMWFHDQLKECVRICVLTRLRHIRRGDIEPASTPVPAPADVPTPASAPVPALGPAPVSAPAPTL